MLLFIINVGYNGSKITKGPTIAYMTPAKYYQLFMKIVKLSFPGDHTLLGE